MQKYTVGFIFNSTLSKVLLMRKQRPEWQKGKYNGVGGKIEPGEESRICMRREVAEETGLQTTENDWVYVGEIKSESYNVDIYALIYRGRLDDASTITDEKVHWFEINNLPNRAIHNLHWVVLLSLDKLKNNDFKHCLVYYP